MASNGKLPDADLGTIPGTTARVLVALVTQTAALRAAFHARFGKALTITSAYRTYAEQETLFRARYTWNYLASAKIDRRWWAGRYWWRKPGYASAATPGTSNHGLGQAIDWGSRVNVLGSDEQKWMVANAPRFGWVWPTLYRSAPYLEPWHFEGWAVQLAAYVTYLTTNGITVPGLILPGGLAPTPTRGDPMFVAIDKPSTRGALIFPDGQWAWVTDAADAQAFIAKGIPAVDLTGPTFANITPPNRRLGVVAPPAVVNVDTAAIAGAIVKALPEQTGGPTLAQIETAVKAALAGLTLKTV